MAKPNEVMIDGVRYVPATDAAVNMDAVIRGLLMQFWGEVGPGKAEVKKKCEGLYVSVYDDDERGEPIEKVLADIARFVK